MTKSITILLLRCSTGIYLIIWGLIKLGSQEKAIAVSDKYYFGLLNTDVLNYGLGVAEVIIGLLVVLGFLRSIAYSTQALIYLVGLLAITPYILDPFGMYLVSKSKVVFFPSTTLFFASIVPLVFKAFDTFSLDEKLKK